MTWLPALLAGVTLVTSGIIAAGCGRADEACAPIATASFNQSQLDLLRQGTKAGAPPSVIVKMVVDLDFGDASPRPTDISVRLVGSPDGKPRGDVLLVATVLPNTGKTARQTLILDAAKG